MSVEKQLVFLLMAPTLSILTQQQLHCIKSEIYAVVCFIM